MEHIVGITVIIGCAAQTPSRWVEVHWMATWRICLESWLIPQWYCRYWRLAAISPEPWRIGIPSGRAVSRLLKIKNPNGTGLEGKASCSMYAKLKLRQCLTKLLSCSFWFSVEACWKAWVCDFHLRNCSAFWPKCLDLETTRAFKFSNSSLASRLVVHEWATQELEWFYSGCVGCCWQMVGQPKKNKVKTATGYLCIAVPLVPVFKVFYCT